MIDIECRLDVLREELARHKLDGFVVPSTDEHISEYVGDYARRLRWLTGFRGSAGTAVVLPAEAAIFVDGRYTLQVRQQVDGKHWRYESVPQTNVPQWLRQHAPQSARVGYDPWLHTKNWVTSVHAALTDGKAQLVAVDMNPVDAIWSDRPSPSDARLFVQPDALTGRTSADKRNEVARWLTSIKADTVVLCALDSIAWIFNIRGSDMAHTPLALAYALVNADGSADLFVDAAKLTDAVIEHLGPTVRRHPREAFAKHIGSLRNTTVAVDPHRTVIAITDALQVGGATIVEARDPVVLPKALKNPAEIAGHRAAQVRDGVALCRFLHWLWNETRGEPPTGLTELAAAERLRAFREETGELRSLSFDTISASGPNAAVVHYYVTEATDRAIASGSLYLVDSGAQYVDGTTDVTRTVAIGKPSAEMRDRFTRVLKGHIALARAVFPRGTRGIQLDAFARQHLWTVGRDFAHATGHGIGAYLDVHEGPQMIHSGLRADEPLAPNMILSNEPGYYKAGEYGIRIENLMLVVKLDMEGAEREMFGFETLTFAPIDRELIDCALLTDEERTWLDSYHAKVAAIIAPGLTSPARQWLLDATRPLDPKQR